jgi:hypothetical protein
MRLSPSQFTALRNLARKRDGEAVDWINIADARALTDLGFAERGRAGWTITPAGSAALETGARQDDGSAGGSSAASVVRFGAQNGGPDEPDDAGND